MVDERIATESSGRDRAGPATAFALFDTALGVCGIAWNDGGVVGVHLPARDAAATRMRLEQKFRDARESEPSADVARTIERIVALLRGERVDLSTVPLDMTGIDKFDRDVYVARARFPPATLVRTARSRSALDDRKRRATLASHSLAIHSPSSCPVIAWSPPTERPVASRRAAV